jgi:glyoxylase-like metal-dependent hydrolase (beta-lactamase superfamily II)
MQIGSYELHAIHCGDYALDGGSMFGVVPKVMWSRKIECDERNRIPLVTRILLALDRSAGRVVLIDSGFGSKWTDEERDRFKLTYAAEPVDAALAEHGLSADDVTDVIITHLHFDHNAGLTVGEQGATVETARPRFNQARHWIHARQLEHALKPSIKDRGSYHPRDILPVHQAELFRPVNGPGEIDLPGIEWVVSDGHTVGQMLPKFVDSDQSALYVCDLIPTRHHLPLPWLLAFDNEPLKSIAEKQEVLKACGRQNTRLMFVHDAQTPLATIDTSGKYAEVKESFDI